MVISGADPHLQHELGCSKRLTGFLIQIFSIMAPIQVVELSHPLSEVGRALLCLLTRLRPAPNLDNLFAWLA